MSKPITFEEIEDVLEPIMDEEILIIKVLKDHFTHDHCKVLADLLIED